MKKILFILALLTLIDVGFSQTTHRILAFTDTTGIGMIDTLSRNAVSHTTDVIPTSFYSYTLTVTTDSAIYISNTSNFAQKIQLNAGESLTFDKPFSAGTFTNWYYKKVNITVSGAATIRWILIGE